jgi:hypothetical protein
MEIDFSTVPNSQGMGRIFYDGREYFLPVALVGELREAYDQMRDRLLNIEDDV